MLGWVIQGGRGHRGRDGYAGGMELDRVLTVEYVVLRSVGRYEVVPSPYQNNNHND